jgi:hypothetical protein
MQQITLRNGNLYLDSELYDTYFNTINAVALLKQESTFLMMPVQQAGGGLLLKIKNAKGDRIVHAIEFFQQYITITDEEIPLNVEWSSELCALTFLLPS